MIIDLAAPLFSLNSDPIKGLEIKALEKTETPDEYKITDKNAITVLENFTDWAIKEAYLVNCGDTEEEWNVVVYLDIPLDYLLFADDSCVFCVSRMEGTTADLV